MIRYLHLSKKLFKRVYLKIEITVKQILIQIQRHIVVQIQIVNQIQKLKHLQRQNLPQNLKSVTESNSSKAERVDSSSGNDSDH